MAYLQVHHVNKGLSNKDSTIKMLFVCKININTGFIAQVLTIRDLKG